MLVLKRKIGEDSTIGEDIRVKVVRVWAGSVYLGIEAPKDIKILRDNATVRKPRVESR